MEDECIQRAVDYMNDCLTGKKEIPDRREKLHDWNIFTSLILATRIRRFTRDNPAANQVARKWAALLTEAFADGNYDHECYVKTYQEILGLKPKGGRLIDFVNFYPISLLCDSLDEKTEEAMIRYVLNKEGGIYYIYEKELRELPPVFASRQASRYLAAMELLAEYQFGKRQLQFVTDWLEENRKDNGCWDMGSSVSDKVYFPLSDNWRKPETREADCTERIAGLIGRLNR